MANVISNVFKEELLKGNHDFDGGATYKLALFTSSKTVSASDPTAFNTTKHWSNFQHFVQWILFCSFNKYES